MNFCDMLPISSGCGLIVLAILKNVHSTLPKLVSFPSDHLLWCDMPSTRSLRLSKHNIWFNNHTRFHFQNLQTLLNQNPEHARTFGECN